MRMNRYVELDLGEMIRQVREDKNVGITPTHAHICTPAQDLRTQLSKILATTRLISSGRLSLPQARQMALQIEGMAQTGLAGKLDCGGHPPPQARRENRPRPVADSVVDDSCLECLSPREREILTALAQGQSVHEIAALLNRSPKTVNNHRTNILHKLHLRNTAELTRLAIRHKLVEP